MVKLWPMNVTCRSFFLSWVTNTQLNCTRMCNGLHEFCSQQAFGFSMSFLRFFVTRQGCCVIMTILSRIGVYCVTFFFYYWVWTNLVICTQCKCLLWKATQSQWWQCTQEKNLRPGSSVRTSVIHYTYWTNKSGVLLDLVELQQGGYRCCTTVWPKTWEGPTRSTPSNRTKQLWLRLQKSC